MTYPNLEVNTPKTGTIVTRWDRRNLHHIALDFDIYYNEGGMDVQTNDEDKAPAPDNDLPDYM